MSLKTSVMLLLEQRRAPIGDVLAARQAHELDALARRALDGREHAPLARRDEQNRVPRTPRPAGAADAMDVTLDVVRDVVVDDVRDALDVEAARRDVGRDDDVELAVLQPLDRALAQRLRHLAAQRGAREPARFELFAELGRRLARAHEDQHRVEILDLENARQRIELVEAAHLDETLIDRRDRRGLRLDLDLDGIVEMVRDDLANAIRQRRREQRDLLLLGHLARECSRRPR